MLFFHVRKIPSRSDNISIQVTLSRVNARFRSHSRWFVSPAELLGAVGTWRTERTNPRRDVMASLDGRQQIGELEIHHASTKETKTAALSAALEDIRVSQKIPQRQRLDRDDTVLVRVDCRSRWTASSLARPNHSLEGSRYWTSVAAIALLYSPTQQCMSRSLGRDHVSVMQAIKGKGYTWSSRVRKGRLAVGSTV